MRWTISLIVESDDESAVYDEADAIMEDTNAAGNITVLDTDVRSS